MFFVLVVVLFFQIAVTALGPYLPFLGGLIAIVTAVVVGVAGWRAVVWLLRHHH